MQKGQTVDRHLSRHWVGTVGLCRGRVCLHESAFRELQAPEIGVRADEGSGALCLFARRSGGHEFGGL